MFWPMMTSSQEPQFFGNFLGFFKEFSKSFLKIYKIWTKIINFPRKLLLKSMLYLYYFYGITYKEGSLSGFWDLLTKLCTRSSWMNDVLPSAPRLFLKVKCGLLHRQGQRIQFQRSIFCAESLAVHTAVACVWLVARYTGIVDR